MLLMHFLCCNLFHFVSFVFFLLKSSDGEYELTLAKMDSKTLTKLQVFIDASIAARPDSVRRAASTPGPLGGAGDKSDSSSSSSSDSDSDSDSD
jgi:hypothetical protein